MATVGEGLAIIQTANQRAGALVSSLKQMSIDQVTQQRRTFDLGHLIDEVLTALGPSIKKHGVAVVKEIESEISMNSFPGPLEQIITNLVQNALVHGFDGRSSGTIIVRGQLVGEQQVRLEVQDDGAGMTADAQARLFEPFFTTRAGMGGSGIGLTSSKKLVEETLCGRIRVETAQGSGTRFTLDLPLNPQRLLSTGTA